MDTPEKKDRDIKIKRATNSTKYAIMCSFMEDIDVTPSFSAVNEKQETK